MIAEFEKRFPDLAAQIGKKHLETLFESARFVDVPAGTHITEDGEPVKKLWLIASGICGVSINEDGRAIHLGRLGKGQWIGEVSLLVQENEGASSTVTAEEEVRLLELSHTDFNRLHAENLEAASALLRSLIVVLAERLRSSGEMLLKRHDGEFALVGSDAVKKSEDNRGWFRRVLQKLFGTEEKSQSSGAEKQD